MRVTGYTEPIVTDNIGFREFVFRCARKISSDLREIREIEPDKIELSDYHKKWLDIYEDQFNKLRTMGDDELKDEVEKAYEKECMRIAKKLDEYKVAQYRLQKMLDTVVKWDPPTTKHSSLKYFMEDQLQQSMITDPEIEEIRTSLKTLERPDPELWRQERLEELLDEIKYHRKGYEDEVESNKKINLWLQQLKDSLPEE